MSLLAIYMQSRLHDRDDAALVSGSHPDYEILMLPMEPWHVCGLAPAPSYRHHWIRACWCFWCRWCGRRE